VRQTPEEINAEFRKRTDENTAPLGHAVHTGYVERVWCYRLTEKGHKLLD
jgi:hypothetical protein